MLKPTSYVLCILFAGIFIAGCSTPYIITVWKNQHAFPGKYNKILVAGLVTITIQRSGLSLKTILKNHLKQWVILPFRLSRSLVPQG